MPSGPSAAANASAQIGVFRDLEHIRATTPESARVLWYSPAYVALLAQRRGVRLERPADAAAFEAQLRATGADYIYLAHLHPRDSAHRLGHPLDPLGYAEPFAREVWRRNGPGGEPRAVLLAGRQVPDSRQAKIEMKLSVVIPCYNEAATIHRILDAVHASPWPDKEIIVVDDCSTDGTRERLHGRAARARSTSCSCTR